MRFMLVFSLVLAACGGGESTTPVHQVGLEPVVDTRPCGDAHVRARLGPLARRLTLGGARVAWLEAPGDDLPGALLVSTSPNTMPSRVATDVISVAGSPALFAFAFAEGGIGAYRASISLRPAVRAFAVAADLTHLAWVEPVSDGWSIRHVTLAESARDESRPIEIARGVFPIVAAASSATWFATYAPDVTSLHRARMDDDEPSTIAVELPGYPEKLVAAGDRAWVALGSATHPSLREVGPREREVFRGEMVDFAADEREVVIGLSHQILRIDVQRELSLGACKLRSLAMNEQEIVAIVHSAGEENWLVDFVR